MNEEPVLLRMLHHLVVEWGAPDHTRSLQLRRAYDHCGILFAVGLVIVQRLQEPDQGVENLLLSNFLLSAFFAHATQASQHQAPFTKRSAIAASYPPNILR